MVAFPFLLWHKTAASRTANTATATKEHVGPLVCPADIQGWTTRRSCRPGLSEGCPRSREGGGKGWCEASWDQQGLLSRRRQGRPSGWSRVSRGAPSHSAVGFQFTFTCCSDQESSISYWQSSFSSWPTCHRKDPCWYSLWWTSSTPPSPPG